LSCFLVQAQDSIQFTKSDRYPIPGNNSTISFNTSGTYVQAVLENDTWHFSNLHLNNSGNNPSLGDFKASAQDSNITITTCQRTNPNSTSVRLRYIVVGQGKQTFNFGLDLKGGYWSVSIDGVNFITENNGWRSLQNGTVIVTGAKLNVSISYNVLPPGFGVPDTSNLPFYQQHSVAIVTAGSVVVSLVLAFLIRSTSLRRRQKTIGKMIDGKSNKINQKSDENNAKGNGQL
jgi:hypothetical protein